MPKIGDIHENFCATGGGERRHVSSSERRVSLREFFVYVADFFHYLPPILL